MDKRKVVPVGTAPTVTEAVTMVASIDTKNG